MKGKVKITGDIFSTGIKWDAQGMLNLDTHILLFALNGSLTAAERKLLAGNPWGISAIVLWEVAKLAQLGRVAIDVESSEFTRIFARVHVWPVDLAVCGNPRSSISGAIPRTN